MIEMGEFWSIAYCLQFREIARERNKVLQLMKTIYILHDPQYILMKNASN